MASALVKSASELLDAGHPLHQSFAKWAAKRSEMASVGAVVRPEGSRNLATAEVGGLTKRQARKFLATFPQFRAQPEPKPQGKDKPKPKGKRRGRRYGKAA